MGGQELRILEEIKWLLSKGHSAWLLAREDSAIYEEATHRGLPTQPIPFKGSAHPRAVFEIAQFVKDERIQLINCHSSSDACTAIAARFFRIPVVRTLHVDDMKTDIVHKCLWRYGNNHVIVVSKWIADRLTKWGFVDSDKISIIPTGVDLQRFKPNGNGYHLRKEFNIAENTKVISEIAMIRPDKGQKYFVRAVDSIADVIPNSLFFIVGSATSPEFLEDIKKEIAALHHRDKVILTGFRNDVENFLSGSDVIVNSSVSEPRSQLIHQAFAMEKIVVASNIGGNAETIRNGENGFLFHSGDVKSLSRTVLSVLGNNMQQIRENARLTAISEFGVDAMMEKTLEIYTGMKQNVCPDFNLKDKIH
jgi:glycosyltransferase involved in cell wall biosynthesis